MHGERETEIYCHGCNSYFTVKLDLDVNGNHEIDCPVCGHVHYRVIENGKVTGDRYRSSMGASYTYTSSSYSNGYSSGADYSAWTSTSTTSTFGTSVFSGTSY